MRTTKKLGDEELRVKKLRLSGAVKKLKADIKQMEYKNNLIAKDLKKSELGLQAMLNTSKDQNKTFLSLLEEAVKKKKTNNQPTVFTGNNAFIAENLTEILKVLKRKGYKVKEKPKRSTSTSSSMRDTMRKTRSKKDIRLSASMKSKKKLDSVGGGNDIESIVVEKTNQYPIKPLPSYHRTLAYGNFSEN